MGAPLRRYSRSLVFVGSLDSPDTREMIFQAHTRGTDLILTQRKRCLCGRGVEFVGFWCAHLPQRREAAIWLSANILRLNQENNKSCEVIFGSFIHEISSANCTLTNPSHNPRTVMLFGYFASHYGRNPSLYVLKFNERGIYARITEPVRNSP